VRNIWRAGLCLNEFAPALATAATPAIPIQERLLGEYAGTALRLFDPYAANAVERFTRFLRSVPMQNQRPVPAAIARETRAAFAFMHSATRREPTYFVATYFDKLTISPGMDPHRARIIAEYGEEVVPQRTCPVFATHAGADASALLSTASGLSADYFRDAPGRPERLHEIFLLTEASHCGFLARYREQAELLQNLSSIRASRVVIEAIGDYEAIAAFRMLHGDNQRVDEADVLEATRIVAMFLNDRPTAYTCIPALVLAFERHGINHGVRQLETLESAVDGARTEFRALTAGAINGQQAGFTERLSALASSLESRLREKSDVGDEEAFYRRQLLRGFPEAVAILTGQVGRRDRAPRATDSLVTLPGLPKCFLEQSRLYAGPRVRKRSAG